MLESLAGVLKGLNAVVVAVDRLGVWNYLDNNWSELGLETAPRADLAAQYLAALQAQLGGPSCVLAATEVRDAVDPVTGPGGSAVQCC